MGSSLSSGAILSTFNWTENHPAGQFIGRFPDECLNEHWLTSLAHARAVIETWQREHNG
jgi:putative transposase